MTMIKILPENNGGHDNLTTNEAVPLEAGWAVIPEALGTPETLEHFPFGEVTVEETDGVPTVTGWRPLPIPEPEAPPDFPAALEDRLEALEMETAAISAAVERGLKL